MFLFFCVAPVRMACGSARAWLALLPPLPVWKQSSPAPGGAASPPSGCATTRTTAATVRTRSAHPPALWTSSAVPTHRGESKLNEHHFMSITLFYDLMTIENCSPDLTSRLVRAFQFLDLYPHWFFYSTNNAASQGLFSQCFLF